MKLGVIGYGVVGKATEAILKRSFDVYYDLQGFDEFEELYSCDIVFICTPTKDKQDIEQVKNYVEQLWLNSNCEIVIRSTVIPGTCHLLSEEYVENSLVYWPEFLREDSWQTDIFYQPNYVTHSIKLCKLIEWDRQFTFDELEIIKIMSNVWSCVQITFANQMNELCKSFEVDMKTIMYPMMCTRLSNYQEGGRPFGGKCLPKDLDLIIDEYKRLGIKESFFTATKRDNSRF